MKNRAFFVFLFLFLPLAIFPAARDFLWRCTISETESPLRSELLRSSDWRDQLAGAWRVSERALRAPLYSSANANFPVDRDRAHDQTIAKGWELRGNLVAVSWVLNQPDWRFGTFPDEPPDPFVVEPDTRDIYRPKTPPTGKIKRRAQSLLELARHGGKLEPRNGFFAWHQARFLLILGREAEALDALFRAASHPEFHTRIEDGISIDARTFWPVPQSAWGTATATYIRFFHFSNRVVARRFVEIAARHRQAGRHDEAFQILESLQRLVKIHRARSPVQSQINWSHSLLTDANFPVARRFVSPAQSAGNTFPKAEAPVVEFRRHRDGLPFYARSQGRENTARVAEELWIWRQKNIEKLTKTMYLESSAGYSSGVSGAVWSAALWPEWFGRRLWPFALVFGVLGALSCGVLRREPPRNLAKSTAIFAAFWLCLVGILFHTFDFYGPPSAWWQATQEPWRSVPVSLLWWSLGALWVWIFCALGATIARRKMAFREILFFPILWLVAFPAHFYGFARRLRFEFQTPSPNSRNSPEIPSLSDGLLWPGCVLILLFFAALGTEHFFSTSLPLPFQKLRLVLPFLFLGLAAFYTLGWQWRRVLQMPRRFEALRKLAINLRDFAQGGAFAFLALFWLLFAFDFYGQRAFQTAWRDVQTRGELAILSEAHAKMPPEPEPEFLAEE